MSWLISVLIAGMMTIGSSDLATNAPKANTKEKTEVAQKIVFARADAQEERFDQTYPLNPNGRVSLSNVNGKVEVVVWDRNEARVEAVKTIECENPMKIDIEVNSSPNSLQIETEYDSEESNDDKWRGNRCRKNSVDFRLTVPRTALLDSIETVNGNISIDGLTDSVKASSVNGQVVGQNLRGAVNLSTVNGQVKAGFSTLDNVREIKLNTVNGQVELQLPSDADATIKASTVNGGISNDFTLPVKKGTYVGYSLYGRLGGGAIPVKLSGVNGQINIRRNSDGRQPRAVQNLLPAGNDDDFEFSMAAPRAPKPPKVKVKPNVVVIPRVSVAPPVAPEAPEIDTDELNETIRESVKESMKAAKEAAKASRIDSEKIRREVEEATRESARLGRESARLSRELARDVRAELDRDLNVEYGFSPMERSSASAPVKGEPKVKINAENGSVRIRGWEKQEVSYSVVSRGGSEKANVNMQVNGSNVNITVSPSEAEDYRLEIFVPRKSDIKVQSTKEIRVEGVKGDLDLEGGEEAVDVRDSSGNLKVAATEGRVRVIGFQGAADVKTTCGSIALEGDFTAISTQTTEGSTALTLRNDVAATIEATTKDVVFDGLTPSGEPKENDQVTIWQLGKGGAKYKLMTAEGGQVWVRSAGNVRVMRNQLGESENDSILME